MRLIFSLLLACASLYAQSFPTSVYSPLVAKDNLTTKLIAPMAPGDTVAIVQNSAGWLPNMVASICESANSGVCVGGFEMMLVGNVAGNVITVTRGYSGSVAVPHASGRAFVNSINSAYNTAISSEMQNLETFLEGANPGVAKMRLGNITAPSSSAPYDTGSPTLAGFYLGNLTTPYATPANTVEAFLIAGTNWLAHGQPYAAYRADVIAPAGSTVAPTGLFISASSDAVNSEVYGIWSTVATSTGSTGAVTKGVLNGYFESRDFTGSGTHVANLAAMELNINTHSGPSDLAAGHLGINIVRQCQAPCPAAGDGMSGTAIQAGGSGNGRADWAGFLRFLQGYDASYILHVDNPNPGGAKGMWRVYNTGGIMTFRTNTAAGRDFSAFQTPLGFDYAANVYIGGAGSPGDAITAYFTANAGLIVLGGGPGAAIVSGTTIVGAQPLGMPGIKSLTGTRYLCINSTGVVVSSATACSGT